MLDVVPAFHRHSGDANVRSNRFGSKPQANLKSTETNELPLPPGTRLNGVALQAIVGKRRRPEPVADAHAPSPPTVASRLRRPVATLALARPTACDELQDSCGIDNNSAGHFVSPAHVQTKSSIAMVPTISQQAPQARQRRSELQGNKTAAGSKGLTRKAAATSSPNTLATSKISSSSRCHHASVPLSHVSGPQAPSPCTKKLVSTALNGNASSGGVSLRKISNAKPTASRTIPINQNSTSRSGKQGGVSGRSLNPSSVTNESLPHCAGRLNNLVAIVRPQRNSRNQKTTLDVSSVAHSTAVSPSASSICTSPPLGKQLALCSARRTSTSTNTTSKLSFSAVGASYTTKSSPSLLEKPAKANSNHEDDNGSSNSKYTRVGPAICAEKTSSQHCGMSTTLLASAKKHGIGRANKQEDVEDSRTRIAENVGESKQDEQMVCEDRGSQLERQKEASVPRNKPAIKLRQRVKQRPFSKTSGTALSSPTVAIRSKIKTLPATTACISGCESLVAASRLITAKDAASEVNGTTLNQIVVSDNDTGPSEYIRSQQTVVGLCSSEAQLDDEVHFDVSRDDGCESGNGKQDVTCSEEKASRPDRIKMSAIVEFRANQAASLALPTSNCHPQSYQFNRYSSNLHSQKLNVGTINSKLVKPPYGGPPIRTGGKINDSARRGHRDLNRPASNLNSGKQGAISATRPEKPMAQQMLSLMMLDAGLLPASGEEDQHRHGFEAGHVHIPNYSTSNLMVDSRPLKEVVLKTSHEDNEADDSTKSQPVVDTIDVTQIAALPSPEREDISARNSTDCDSHKGSHHLTNTQFISDHQTGCANCNNGQLLYTCHRKPTNRLVAAKGDHYTTTSLPTSPHFRRANIDVHNGKSRTYSPKNFPTIVDHECISDKLLLALGGTGVRNYMVPAGQQVLASSSETDQFQLSAQKSSPQPRNHQLPRSFLSCDNQIDSASMASSSCSSLNHHCPPLLTLSGHLSGLGHREMVNVIGSNSEELHRSNFPNISSEKTHLNEKYDAETHDPNTQFGTKLQRLNFESSEQTSHRYNCLTNVPDLELKQSREQNCTTRIFDSSRESIMDRCGHEHTVNSESYLSKLDLQPPVADGQADEHRSHHYQLLQPSAPSCTGWTEREYLLSRHQSRSNSIGGHDYRLGSHSSRMKPSVYIHQSPYVDAQHHYFNQINTRLQHLHSHHPSGSIKSTSPLHLVDQTNMDFQQRDEAPNYMSDRQPRNQMYASLECLNSSYTENDLMHQQSNNLRFQQHNHLNFNMLQRQHQTNLTANQHYAPSYVLSAPPANTIINSSGDQDLAAAAMGNPPHQYAQSMSRNSPTSNSTAHQQQQQTYGNYLSQNLLNRAVNHLTQSPLKRAGQSAMPGCSTPSNIMSQLASSHHMRPGHSSLSLASSYPIEEKLQNEIKKLQSEIQTEKDKNEALNNQLNINSSLMAAFEQSLTTLNTRLRQLTTMNEQKDKDLDELKEQLRMVKDENLASFEKRHEAKTDIGVDSNTDIRSKMSPNFELLLENGTTPRPDNDQNLVRIIEDLRRQLIEKDRLLTDTRLEALSAAHQLEQLESKLNGEHSLIVHDNDVDEGVMVANHSPSDSEAVTDSALFSEFNSQISKSSNNVDEVMFRNNHIGEKNTNNTTISNNDTCNSTIKSDSNSSNAHSNLSNISLTEEHQQDDHSNNSSEYHTDNDKSHIQNDFSEKYHTDFQMVNCDATNSMTKIMDRLMAAD